MSRKSPDVLREERLDMAAITDVDRWRRRPLRVAESLEGDLLAATTASSSPRHLFRPLWTSRSGAMSRVISSGSPEGESSPEAMSCSVVMKSAIYGLGSRL